MLEQDLRELNEKGIKVGFENKKEQSSFETGLRQKGVVKINKIF